ncbi:hypothetical protein ACFWAR_23890 [Streptomyces sp. NPDC059917]|uniref:hypothetical protein n=1 Tax=Streptomyces sp. NPDC059917 TaxID=3347002 RepID=UPI003668C357
MGSFLLAAVLIFGITAALLAFVVKALSSTPARIAVVVGAIVGVLVAFPPVVEALKSERATPSPTAPAPVERGVR